MNHIRGYSTDVYLTLLVRIIFRRLPLSLGLIRYHLNNIN